MNEGWICPRCGRVNAPFRPYCDCKFNTRSNLTKSACNHHWILDRVSTTGSHYRCMLCGETKIESYDQNYNGVTLY